MSLPVTFRWQAEEELAEATKEFDQDSVDATFGRPTKRQQAQLELANRKRGRPKVGQGAVVISGSSG